MNKGKWLIAILLAIAAHGAAAREIKVQAGQSIQAAVDQAAPGDSVMVMPGTYHETGRACPSEPTQTCAVVVSTDNLSLVAQPRSGQPVTIENDGGQLQGIAFGKPGISADSCLNDTAQHIDGAQITGFTVSGFLGTGIFLFCVDNFIVSSNNAVNNQLYGVFPVFSSNGRITGNVASGARDTGIYIGQSSNVRIDHNTASSNVAGFELENSNDMELDHNESFANTAGILMFIIPDDVILTSQNNSIHHNQVHDNNSPNNCISGDDVCLVPPGIGISSAGGANNSIDHNTVVDNQTFGIALEDVCTAFQIPAGSCILGFDPLPEATHIEFNTAEQNGSSPALGFYGADLTWTGNGTGNCWQHNTASLIVPSPLPACTNISRIASREATQ